MTVAELIALLDRYDPDMPVLRRTRDPHVLVETYPHSLDTAFAEPMPHSIGNWIDKTDRERERDNPVLVIG